MSRRAEQAKNPSSPTLTTPEYWASYYLPENNNERSEIERICGEYDRIWEILVSSCAKKPETILEIGAHPGRYLAYLASRYKLRPSALDFNPDIAAIRRSMNLMNINQFRYLNEDFLKHQTKERYNLVLSIGFIEHFANFDEVLDRHCDYLDANGAMLIMIPHMRYGQYFHRRIFDRANLDVHNLKCMKKSVFKNFAKRNDLKIHYLSYFGGFLTNVHGKKPQGIKRFCNRIERLAFKAINPALKRFPSTLYSSVLIGIFSKMNRERPT
jgi:cyclopropane fatty-acyl-phospholipid synthase-like methyltransferase